MEIVRIVVFYESFLQCGTLTNLQVTVNSLKEHAFNLPIVSFSEH